MDAGVWEGKRYLIPYCYTADIDITTDRMLKEFGFSEDREMIRGNCEPLPEHLNQVKQSGRVFFAGRRITSSGC